MYKESALPDFEQTEVASRAVTSQHNHGENGTNCTQTGWGGDMTASSAVGVSSRYSLHSICVDVQ